LPKRRTRNLNRFFWLLLLFLAGAAQASAQDTTLTATVTQIAGDNAYINVGRDAGIQATDTLRVGAGGRLLGRMIVLSTASKQSVLRFVNQSFPITRGMKVEITFTRRSAAIETTPAEVIAEAPAPEKVPVTTSARAPDKKRRQAVRVDGRATLGLSLLSSETRPIGSDFAPVGRQFATPSLNLNVTVRNLPSQTRLHASMRAEHRGSSVASILPERSMRTYQLSLQKDLSFGEMQFGRFYNNLTPHGGYWDGGSFLIGSRNAGMGVAAGFMPEQANEGFTTDFPRISGFAQYRTPAGKPWRYRAAVSYHEVHPTAIYLDHRFSEFSQEFDWGAFSIDQDIAIDQNPLTKDLVVSQFQIDPRVRLTDQIQLRGRYSLRQPYRMYSTVTPFSTRRDQIGAGFTVRGGDASFGGEYATRYTEGAYDSRTIIVYGATPFFQPLNLSLNANGSRWTSDFGEALYAAAGLTKGFGGGNVRLEYAFYRTTTANQTDPIDAHRYSASASVPLGRTLYWNARVTLQQSRFLSSVSGQTSLQIRF